MISSAEDDGLQMANNLPHSRFRDVIRITLTRLHKDIRALPDNRPLSHPSQFDDNGSQKPRYQHLTHLRPAANPGCHRAKLVSLKSRCLPESAVRECP
jgi:hypothetical protein